MRRAAFSAVRGMELAKKALMCAAVDPDIKGVLIRGPSGTAKSVLVRSFSRIIPDRKLVEVPQNITEEDMFGGLDMEATIKAGRKEVSKGLMSRADGNLLHIDNANLLDPKILSSVTECVLSGEVKLERGAVSAEYSVDTTLLATMDPIEGELSASVADRFDICVSIIPERDAETRADIAAAVLGLGDDSSDAEAREDTATVERIRAAGSIIGGIGITRATALRIAEICAKLEARGHRGEISVARTARALAALRMATEIGDEDLKDAAVMCLSHRAWKPAAATDDADDGAAETEAEEEVRSDVECTEDPEEVMVDYDAYDVYDVYDEAVAPDAFAAGEEDPEEEDTLFEEIREEIECIATFENLRLHDIVGAGKRTTSRASGIRRGRQRGDRIPDGKPVDPAFGATIREAAPYQRTRSPDGSRVVIKPQDIRDKVRIRRDSNAFLFMVDVSGSLAVGNMMSIIQEAIRAMLAESYIKRDRVALMTFRADNADIAVPFTHSVETICSTLEKAPVGDATPLNLALMNARAYLVNHARKYPDEKRHVVIITDGQGNVPIVRGAQPLSELKKLTAAMEFPDTTWTVIDSGFGHTGKKDAARLAGWLGARYVRMSDLGDY